ncbi:MAG TPA: SDR family NAD(P)-dependent oxidoreductase [Anaerolineae bacterium]|nr:SDR family NAD(P)-dependent oxidoreductase [Anaerolineae bacterium]
MRFKDRVAIVTGSARGLGRAIAVALGREGSSVVIVDLNPTQGAEVLREIEELEAEAIFVRADVSQRAEVDRMVQATLNRFNTIDILVNNAGIHDAAPFVEETAELWQRMFKVNVMGTVLPSQAVVPEMMKRKKGRIVNISSKAAVVGEPYHAAYSASKGAVLALTRAMATELAPYKITVNAVCPGPTYTDMLLGATDEAQRNELTAIAPLGRLGKPEDIASAVLYLASEESDWCTGQALSVDGGMSILK